LLKWVQQAEKGIVPAFYQLRNFPDFPVLFSAAFARNTLMERKRRAAEEIDQLRGMARKFPANQIASRKGEYRGSSPSPPTRNEDAKAAEEKDDRGRSAASPYDIPARGWKDILLRAYGNVASHRIMLLAAGMTYYSLLGIFPAIAALVAVYGLFSDPSTIARHLDQLGGFMPGGAIDVAREQLTRVSSKGTQALGLTFLVGLGVSLWSANAAMKSLFDTLNIVYDEEETRGFVKLNAISLSFTICAVLFMLAALGSIVAVPVILNYAGLSNASDLLLRIGRWPAMFLILAFALAIIYRHGPNREAPRWRWITWGSAIAALLWLGVSALFSWYAANFGKFNETYGSLGAVIGFMTWLWISAIVILFGAEINAEMEHQTALDTTTGAPEPIGKRGARMADTVGAAQGG
jgi:membrane protein